MKLRDHKKYEYVVWIEGKRHAFKYKSKLMAFLNGVGDKALNEVVEMYFKTLNSSYTHREWLVWWNDSEYRSGASFKIVLKQLPFREKKYVFPHRPYDKKWFAVSALICREMQKEEINFEKLLKLFYKRGFVDRELNEEEKEYVDSYINEIPYSYWSDRCNWLRTKTIYEQIRSNGTTALPLRR